VRIPEGVFSLDFAWSMIFRKTGIHFSGSCSKRFARSHPARDRCFAIKNEAATNSTASGSKGGAMLRRADVAARQGWNQPVAPCAVMLRRAYIALRQIYCAARLPSCADEIKRPQGNYDSSAICRVAECRRGERSNGASGKFRHDENIAAAGSFRQAAHTTKFKEKTLMAIFAQQQDLSDTRVSNDMIKLIRKLRWIGMDEEAQKLQTELTQREAAAADSVIATSHETD
jgi:hypothetical protein